MSCRKRSGASEAPRLSSATTFVPSISTRPLTEDLFHHVRPRLPAVLRWSLIADRCDFPSC